MKNRNRWEKMTQWLFRNRDRVRDSAGNIIVSSNFSDVEDDVNAFQIIRNLAAHAGNNAAAKAKAAGLSRVYIRNYKDLIKVSVTGEEVFISPRIKQASFYIKYKPSTVLNAVKK
jgi:hypothetical protein